MTGSYLKIHRSKPINEYIDQLRRSPFGRLDSIVEEVLIMSWSALSDPEQAAFTALSVMPTNFDREAALAVIAPPPQTLDGDATPTTLGTLRTLSTFEPSGTLVAYHLLRYNEQTARYAWHDLVKTFADARLREPARSAALRQHAAHFTQVGEHTDELYLQGGEHVVAGLALFDQERIHIQAAFQNLGGLGDLRGLVTLVNAVVYTGNLRFHPRQRIAWLTAQAKAARASGDKGNEGNALRNLGLAYKNLGEPRRAIEFYEQALVIDRAIGDRRGKGIASWNLGLRYEAQGELARAIALMQVYVDYLRELGHPDADKRAAHVDALRTRLTDAS